MTESNMQKWRRRIFWKPPPWLARCTAYKLWSYMEGSILWTIFFHSIFHLAKFGPLVFPKTCSFLEILRQYKLPSHLSTWATIFTNSLWTRSQVTEEKALKRILERSSTEVLGSGHGENTPQKYEIRPGRGLGFGSGHLTQRRRRLEPTIRQRMPWEVIWPFLTSQKSTICPVVHHILLRLRLRLHLRCRKDKSSNSNTWTTTYWKNFLIMTKKRRRKIEVNFVFWLLLFHFELWCMFGKVE